MGMRQFVCVSSPFGSEDGMWELIVLVSDHFLQFITIAIQWYYVRIDVNSRPLAFEDGFSLACALFSLPAFNP